MFYWVSHTRDTIKNRQDESVVDNVVSGKERKMRQKKGVRLREDVKFYTRSGNDSVW